LAAVEGIRLSFASNSSKKGHLLYSKWHRQQTRAIKKLLDIKEKTVWDTTGGKSRKL
jgi:hypothetical protein